MANAQQAIVRLQCRIDEDGPFVLVGSPHKAASLQSKPIEGALARLRIILAQFVNERAPTRG
jgi:hypothetical protein